MPRKQRKLETSWRHKFEAFVPHFFSEVHLMISDTLYERYVQLPWWWAEVELPYGLRLETPRTVVYFSRRLIQDDDDVMWSVLRTEWAGEALKEVILAARGGRLWWSPPAVRADIRRINVAQILRYCHPGVLSDANALLNFTDRADWSRCPVRHGFLPDVAKRCSPVFNDTGDFFEFDAVNWRPISAPLLEADADGALARKPSGLGVRRYRSTLGMPSFGFPDGYPRGRDAAYPSARARAAGDAGA